MNLANPWFHFGAFLVFALFVCLGELGTLLFSHQGESTVIAEAEALAAENRQRRLAVEGFRERAQKLEPAASAVLKGLLRKGDEDPDLAALESAGMRALPSQQDESAAIYTIRSNSLEFHSLVPALSLQEQATPLMRCARLSFRTTQKAFYTSAISLNSEMELVFPKADSSSGLSGGSSAPKPSK
jgi:hypothetical protein